jgi:hypothetical protein
LNGAHFVTLSFTSIWRLRSNRDRNDFHDSPNDVENRREDDPNKQQDEYWSANDYSFQYNAAWVWNFQFGHDRVDWKTSAKFVRLVRGTASELPKVKESPMDQ